MMNGQLKSLFLSLYILGLSITELGAQVSGEAESGSVLLSPLTIGAASAVIWDAQAGFVNPGSLALRHERQWNVFYDRTAPGKIVTGFFISRRAALQQRSFYWGIGACYHYRNLVPLYTPPASADDLIAFFSFGRNFLFNGHTISLGASQKYWSSHFAHRSAHSLLWDVGGVFRSQPFDLFRNAKGAVSFGAAITQLGSQITWYGRPSEMPPTLRCGASLSARFFEKHTLMFAAEYIHAQKIGDYLGLGAELDFGRVFQIKTCRILDRKARQEWFVGVGIRLHGSRKSIGTLLPRQDGALQVDFLTAQEGERSAVFCSYSCNAPAAFALSAPVAGDTLGADRMLRWQQAFDADWFDTLRYRVVLDTDSVAVSVAVDEILNKGAVAANERKRLLFDQVTHESGLKLPNLPTGRFYWSVVAVDNDGHATAAKRHGRPERLIIPPPKAVLRQIDFIPNQRLNSDDLQGKFILKIENLQAGEHAVRLIVTERPAEGDVGNTSADEQRKELRQLLPPGQSEIEISWHSGAVGSRDIEFALEPVYGIPYVEQKSLTAVTIPRGRISGDSIKTIRVSKKITYVPLLRSVSFHQGSTKLCEDYQTEQAVQPIVRILAQRLKAFPQTVLQIQGMIDPDSGEEDLSLAWERARAVRDLLAEAGADTLQMQLSALRLKKRNYSRLTQGLDWILQERRCVCFSSTAEDAALLFAPIQQENASAEDVRISLHTDIRSSLSLQKMLVEWQADNGTAGVYLIRPERIGQDSVIQWILSADKVRRLAGSMLNYRLTLTDSLGRIFSSEFLPLHLRAEESVDEEVLMVPFEFAQDVPDRFAERELLQRLADITSGREEYSLQIVGRTCPIGDPAVNERLARRRAEGIRRRLAAMNGGCVGQGEYRVDALESKENSSARKHIALPPDASASSPARRQLLRCAEILLRRKAILPS